MKNKSHNIIRTEPYKQDLNAIATWIYECTYSIESVEKVIDRIEDYVDYLEVLPYLGVAGKIAGTREIYPNGYRVVYRVVGNEVRILTVMHGSRKYP